MKLDLEMLLFDDLFKCGQTNGQVFVKAALIYYGIGGSAKLCGGVMSVGDSRLGGYEILF